MRRALYALVLLVYMSTPYVSLGFHASSCECMVGAIKCGTSGALCHCCMGEKLAMQCDDSTHFKSCRNSTGAQATSQPPAITEPFASCSSTYAMATFLPVTKIISSNEFDMKPFKPPRAA